MVRLRNRSREAAPDTAPEVYPQESATPSGPNDGALHLSDQTCARCGREIKPTDDARRTATGDCVHLCC